MFVTLGVLIDISTSRTALRGFDTVSALRNFTKAFCFDLFCFVLFVNVLHQSTVKWSFSRGHCLSVTIRLLQASRWQILNCTWRAETTR